MMTRIRLIVAALLTLALAGLAPAHPTFAATGTQVADCSFATLQTDLQAGGDYYYAPGQCPNEIVATSTIVINTHASLTAQGKDIRIGAPADMWQGYTQFFQVYGDFELTGLTLRGGNDQYTEASGGGAIFNAGTTTITDCTFWNNMDNGLPGQLGAGGAGRGGGAIYNQNGTMTITNSTFVGNNSMQAGAQGTAGGGAIENWEGSLTISNSTFSSNWATGSGGPEGVGYGGAIFNEVPDPSFAVTITNSTFDDNSFFGTGQLSGGPFIISGTLMKSSDYSLLSSGRIGPNCDAGAAAGYIDMASLFIDKGNNLEDDAGASCGFSAAHHDIVGQDPQLGSLQYNGGPTQTRALGPASPAIDAMPVSSGNCPATDQRGTPRPDNGESACDIGAYEAAYAGTTTTLATSGSPSAVGQSVTYTATVAVPSGTPTGTVEFRDGGSDVAGCASVALTGGTATCTVTYSGTGSHTITAGYSGDGSDEASTSNSLTQQVTDSDLNLAGVPSDILAMATSAQGATVTYAAPTAVDEDSPLPSVTCAPSSSSVFPVGLTTVTCTVADSNDTNSPVSASFTVRVDTNLAGYPKLSSGAYNLGNASLNGAYLWGANLAGATMQNGTFTHADFTNATLTGANLSQANLSYAAFSGANLSNANLSQANLTGATGLNTATLTSVTWNKTTCPDGTNSSKDGGTCLQHLTP